LWSRLLATPIYLHRKNPLIILNEFLGGSKNYLETRKAKAKPKTKKHIEGTKLLFEFLSTHKLRLNIGDFNFPIPRKHSHTHTHKRMKEPIGH
jgi:hypothetical protein